VLGLVTYIQSSLPPPVVPSTDIATQSVGLDWGAATQMGGAQRESTGLAELPTLSNFPRTTRVAATPWLPVDLSEGTMVKPRSAAVMVLDQVQSDEEDFLTID